MVGLAGPVLAAVGLGTASEDGGVPSGEAELRYVQHSGWLVRTAGHLLIFDYVGAFPDQPSLPPGVAPEPNAFGHQRVVVLVTHAHADHYSPAVLGWAAERPDIQYVLGWPLPGRPAEARVMEPREDWSSGGLRVRTTGSTDEGVGFLVTVDGLTIYHAGDHALWSDGVADAFEAEIRWLKAQGAAIDIALLPVATGHACEPRPSIWNGCAAPPWRSSRAS